MSRKFAKKCGREHHFVQNNANFGNNIEINEVVEAKQHHDQAPEIHPQPPEHHDQASEHHEVREEVPEEKEVPAQQRFDEDYSAAEINMLATEPLSVFNADEVDNRTLKKL